MHPLFTLIIFELTLLSCLLLTTCVTESRESLHLKVDYYCMLWHDEERIIFSSSEVVYVARWNGPNMTYFKIFEWPVSMTTKSKTSNHSFHCYPILSAINVRENLFEFCGFMQTFTSCQLFAEYNDTWKWVATRPLVSSIDIGFFKQNYHEGHLVQLFTGLNGEQPLMRFQTVLPNLNVPQNPRRLDSTGTASANHSSFRWWSGTMETSNRNDEQFSQGPDFQFHAVAVATGRRYVLFNEQAAEVVSRDTMWALKKHKTVFARIARICVGDPGVQLPDDGRTYLTSFFKARLLCRIEADQQRDSLYYRFFEAVDTVNFNHIVAASQVWTTVDGRPDSFLFVLLSVTTTMAWRRVGFNVPIALCVYRLADVDRLFHLSDLIKINTQHPVWSVGSFETDHPMNQTNAERRRQSLEAPRSSLPVDYHRIRRIYDRQLSTITDCPGPSWHNIRLALEAPMLADPLYPVEAGPLAVVQIKNRVTCMTVDPRWTGFFDDRNAKGQKQTKSVVYIGTELGEVFKLMMNSNGDRLNQRNNLSNSVCVQKLIDVQSKQAVQSILLVKLSQTGRRSIVGLDKPVFFKQSDRLQLLVMNGRQMLYIDPDERNLHASRCSHDNPANGLQAMCITKPNGDHPKELPGCARTFSNVPFTNTNQNVYGKFSDAFLPLGSVSMSNVPLIVGPLCVWILISTAGGAFVIGVFSSWLLIHYLYKRKHRFLLRQIEDFRTQRLSNHLLHLSPSNRNQSCECQCQLTSFRRLSNQYGPPEDCPIIPSCPCFTWPGEQLSGQRMTTVCLNNDLKVNMASEIQDSNRP